MESYINTFADGDLRWKLIRSYFGHNSIVKPQIESYEYFMDEYLPKIVGADSKIWSVVEDKHRRDCFWFDGVTVKRPQYEETDGTVHDITPDDAMKRRITYECGVLVDVYQKTLFFPEDCKTMNEGEEVETEQRVYRNIRLFQFPCMVKSKYCHWHNRNVDPANNGAIFIIGGHEKGMLNLMKMRTNYPVTRIESKKDAPVRTKSEVRSAGLRWRSTSTIHFLCETIGGGGRSS